MSLQQIVAQKHQSLEGEMLFVRNTAFASSRTLDFTIYPDGSTHVFYELDVDPLELEIIVELFGEMIENITIIDEDGFLLSSEINHNSAVIETFGASRVSIDYDTQDLVSKTGKIWSFSVDAPIQYSLLTPQDSVIIEMGNFPLTMQVDNDQSYLTFPPGKTNISYYISTLASAQSTQSISEDGVIDNSLFLYVGGIAAAATAAAIAIKKRKSSRIPEPTTTIQKDEQSKPQSLDPDTIFKTKQDLREDDKEIINFLSANGGQAYESELRKKFLQPRTTMWRAVKRLERQGIIEIEKKDLQNIVKLKSKLEDT